MPRKMNWTQRNTDIYDSGSVKYILKIFKITNKNFNLLGSIFEYKKVVIFCKMGLYRSKTIEIGLSYFPIS